MSHAPIAALPVDPIDPFRVGTLRYTHAGLISLFFWLLWGDFVFILMESVMPSIVPLKLHALGASDLLLGLTVISIPRAMDFIVNPIVGYMSDRTRTRWGRRRPYLLLATPIVTVTLLMMAYSPELTRWASHHTPSTMSPAKLGIGVIAILMVLFQFANMFINSIYYYYFNDVVPHGFLARFISLFRVVGMLAGTIYGYYIYGKGETNSREILLWTALAYLIVFGGMCLVVKEGEYPPPPRTVDGKHGIVSGIRTFAAECFTKRIYWYFFLVNTCWAVAMSCTSTYAPFYAAANGVSLNGLGKLGAVNNLLVALLLYPMGMLADRKHPLNVNYWGAVIIVCVTPLQLIFLYRGLPPHILPLLFFGLCGLGSVLQAVYAASELPMYMKILPQELYGQFCSANSMVRAVALIAGAPAAGFFLDAMRRFDKSPNDHYNYCPAWILFFMVGCTFFLYLLRREWKQLGGPKGYAPPRIPTDVPADAFAPEDHPLPLLAN